MTDYLYHKVFSERLHTFLLDKSLFLGPDEQDIQSSATPIMKSIVLAGINNCATLYIKTETLKTINSHTSEQAQTLKAFLVKHIKEESIKVAKEDCSNIEGSSHTRALIMFKEGQAFFQSSECSLIYNIQKINDQDFDLQLVPNGVVQLGFSICKKSLKAVTKVTIKLKDKEIIGTIKESFTEFNFELTKEQVLEIKKLNICVYFRDKVEHLELLIQRVLGQLKSQFYLVQDNKQLKLSTRAPTQGKASPKGNSNKQTFKLAKKHKVIPVSPSLEITEQLAAGQTVKKTDKTDIILGGLLGAGGEGQIYHAQDNPNVLVKIYTKKIPSHLENKVKRMTELKSENMINDKCIAYPKDLVYQNNKFIGYTMNKVQGETLHIMNYANLKDNPEVNDRKALVQVAINYIKVIQNIHRHNILLVDINEGNILVDLKTKLVSIVDLDSAQIEEFPCTVGIEDNFSGDMIQKRIQYAQSNQHVLSSMSDELFSIYVFVFMILMGGRHPYDHKKRDMSAHKNIIANFVYPYANQGNRDLIPGSVTPKLWDNFNDDVRENFSLAFRNKTMDLKKLKKSLESYLTYLNQNPSKAQIFF